MDESLKGTPFIRIFEGRKCKNVEPQPEATPVRQKKTKTDFDKLKWIAEHFPKVDESLMHKLISWESQKKKEIMAIKAAAADTSPESQPNGKFLETFDMMLRDLDENPKLALHMMRVWMGIRWDSVKEQLG